jgi:hypothetical protein
MDRGRDPPAPARGRERGRVHERLGNREVAADAYRFVADVWRNADPELQPFAQEAARGLARLNAETAGRGFLRSPRTGAGAPWSGLWHGRAAAAGGLARPPRD